MYHMLLPSLLQSNALGTGNYPYVGSE